MSETEIGKLTVVSPSMPPLTSISSVSVNRVSESLTSPVSLTQCTPQENNITENRLQMMERNIFSLGETLNWFIEAQRTSREQVRNEGMYSTMGSQIRKKYRGSHRSRSPHRRHHIHHIHRQRSESSISPAASQSDIDDDSESDFVYYNPTAVTENQSISSQVREASSNVKDQSVETHDILGEINSNNLVSTNTGPAISGQLAEVAQDTGGKSLGNPRW